MTSPLLLVLHLYETTIKLVEESEHKVNFFLSFSIKQNNNKVHMDLKLVLWSSVDFKIS